MRDTAMPAFRFLSRMARASVLALMLAACGALGSGRTSPSTAADHAATPANILSTPVDPMVPPGARVGFADEVDAIIAASTSDPRAHGGTLLVGSSIFRLWSDAEADLARFAVVNHAFGGARTWELLAYMDALVLAFRPRTVVVYCGSNDVNAGEPAERIVLRLARFTERVEAALPGARVMHVSICRAPEKRARWAVVDAANAELRRYCAARPNRAFVDVNDGLFDASGEPRTDLYLPDGLHFVREAYSEVFLPRVARALDASPSREAH